MSLDLFNRFLAPLLTRAAYQYDEKNGVKCRKCKEKMIDTVSYLYLIPAHFDDEHEECAAYYLHNAKPIESTEQIPSGNRACRMFIFQCQSCGDKKVSIVDFLKVRDYEIVKSGDVYPYEEFQDFFNSCKE